MHNQTRINSNVICNYIHLTVEMYCTIKHVYTHIGHIWYKWEFTYRCTLIFNKMLPFDKKKMLPCVDEHRNIVSIMKNQVSIYLFEKIIHSDFYRKLVHKVVCISFNILKVDFFLSVMKISFIIHVRN